jgi:peptide/nickel transport system substrate-binding protein
MIRRPARQDDIFRRKAQMHPNKPSRFGSLAIILFVFQVSAVLGQTQYLQRQDLSGARGGNLVAAVSSDPSTFNRMLTQSLAEIMIADRISADLVHVNRGTFELEPALATSWETGKDGRTHIIHLRRGVRFSDGSPFTADDVLFSFQVLQDPKSEALQADQVKVDGAYPEVSRVDAHTVRLVFPRAVGMGLRCLDSIPMLPKHRLLKSFEAGKIAAAWRPATPPDDIVGLGAFRLKEYQRGIRVVLERNPYYWKKDRLGQLLPYLDTITFLIISDRNAEALRFGAGELDVINSLNPDNYATLRRGQQGRNYTLRDLGASLTMDFLWFNLNPGSGRSGRRFVEAQKQAIFEQAPFRRAVSEALDRDGMVRSLLLGLGSPQFGPISSGNQPWYDKNIPRIPYDPQHAKQLLAQIGLKDVNADGVLEFGGGRPLEIDLLTAIGSTIRENMAQVIKSNLLSVGIRVTPHSVTTNEIITRLLDSFEYEAILFGFTPTDVVPDLQTDVWYSSGKNHFWHPGQTKPQRAWEAELDAQISRLILSLDPIVRKSSFNRVQQIWAGEMPAIPTVAVHVITGFSNRVGNLRFSILSPHLFCNAEELTKSPAP